MPAVTNILLFCPLTVFVWSGCTCRSYKTPARQRRTHFVLLRAANSFCLVLLCAAACHDVNLLFPHTQSMHSTIPSQIASFGWSIIPAGRTSQKRLEQGPKIDPFPSPHHQTTPPSYLLPLTHGPTMSCIGWVQAGGAWALRVLPSQICPRVCLLFMCLP